MIPLENQQSYQPYLYKIIIPAKLKKTIREQLNITWEAIYLNETPEEKEITDKIEKIVKTLKQKYFHSTATCQ